MEFRVITELNEGQLQQAAELYAVAGWIDTPLDGKFIVAALHRSEVAVGAFDGDKLIGLARALSDGVSDAYIQDVVVSPAYRKQGIGGELIRQVYRELRRKNVDWIALVGEPGTEKFYRELKLQERPHYTLWQFPADWEENLKD